MNYFITLSIFGLAVALLLAALLRQRSLAKRNIQRLQNELDQCRHACEALRQSELKFRMIADWTDDWETWTDPDGRPLYVSPACKRMTGYDADAFLQEPNMFGRLAHSDDRARWEAHMQKQAYNSGQRCQMRLRIHTAQGAERWIEHACQAVYDAEGTFLGRRASNRDVTENERMTRKLTREQRRLKNIETGMDLATWEWDVQTGETVFNAHWAEMLGYRPADLGPTTIQTWRNLTHPDDLPAVDCEINRHIRGESQSYESEFRMRHKKGQWVWVRDCGRLMDWTDDGKPLKMYGAHIDITKDKRAEAALKKSEEKFTKIFEAVPILMAISEIENGRYIDVNPIFLDTLGFTRQEVIGHTSSELGLFLNPDDRTAALAEILAKDGMRNKELVIRGKNGREHIGYLCGQLVDIGGRQRLVTAFNDVTDRKSAEKSLRQMSERLKLAVQAADVGIWELDVANDRLNLDSNLCRLYGFDPQHREGDYQLWKDALHPDDLPEAHAAFQRFLDDDQPFNTEFRIIRPDGAIRYLRANASVQRHADGSPSHVVGINWDVTDYKHAVQQAQAANQAKSAFLANMSHEIRTPMSAVLGLTDLLLDSRLTDQQQGYAQKIKNSGLILLNLIDDILDLSKIEAGKLTLTKQPFSLKRVLENTIGLYSAQAEQKGLKLNVRINPVAPARPTGDSQRLTQIIANLVSNAVKFTDSGEVTVRAEAGPAIDGRVNLKIWVQDTGIGISAEALPLLFSAFNQADASITRRYGGSGLGLAICKQLADLMGGALSVDSTPGRGSIFSLELCLPVLDEDIGAEPKAAPAGLSETAAGRFFQARALVVEDRRVNRDMLVEFLLRMGITADSAADGRQAVNLVQQNDYDVVLMDIQMPHMDGLAASRAIRALKRPGLENLPILAMTARAMPEDREQSLAAGMNDHLVKPIKRGELASALEKWLPRQTGSASAVKNSPPKTAAPVEGAAAGDPNWLKRRIERMRRAMVNDEPLPCKKILAQLRQFKWSADEQNALAAIGRQVERYRLAEALALLNNHFNADSKAVKD